MESVSGVFVPVEVLAHEQGVTTDLIIERIQAGDLIGRRQSNGWHVLVRVPPGEQSVQAAPAAAGAAGGRVVAELNGPLMLAGGSEVVVTDVNIRLGTLIGLTIKLFIAILVTAVIVGGLGFGLLLLLESYGQGLIDAVMGFIGPYLQ